MIDPTRILQPLEEARADLERLADYGTTTELSGAVQAAWHGVERSLRLWLRSDAQLPDAVRLAALSPTELPTDRLIETLRQRNHVSIELAGMSHELARAASRAAQGSVRAGDADVALSTVDRLRREVHDAGEAPGRQVAHHAVEAGALEDETHTVPPPRLRRGRRFWLVAAAAFVALTLVTLLVMPGGLRTSFSPFAGDDLKEGVEAFNRGRLGVAESSFRKVLARDPDNISALLFLGRILRREGRSQEAADMLRRAAVARPDDPDVRRELGNLLMDLKQPGAAAEQYRQAVNSNPEESLNWIGLVRALREAGSLQAAEQMLRRAPPDAQAALGG